SLTARIGPIEGPQPGNDLPDGQVRTVSTSQLINMFPDLLTCSGFLIPEEATGAAASVGTDGLAPVPTTTTRDEGGFDLQSAAYAVEWLISAAMALYMWFQLHRGGLYAHRPRGEVGPARTARPPHGWQEAVEEEFCCRIRWRGRDGNRR